MCIKNVTKVTHLCQGPHLCQDSEPVRSRFVYIYTVLVMLAIDETYQTQIKLNLILLFNLKQILYSPILSVQ